MLYSEARPLIKSGDMLAFSHVGWNSWHDIKIQAVRMWQRSEYAHIGTAWVQGGRVFCLEAVVPTIRIFPLSKMGEFYWIPTNAVWTPEAEEYALSIIGEKYSQLEAMKSVFEKPKVSNNLWQCCEYADEVLKKAGVDLQAKEITPTGMMHAAMSKGYANVLVQGL